MTSGDPLRQRAGTDEPAFSGLVRGAADRVSPGKPTQDARVESFHGRLRDECLTVSWFQNLLDARRKIAAWKTESRKEWIIPSPPDRIADGPDLIRANDNSAWEKTVELESYWAGSRSDLKAKAIRGSHQTRLSSTHPPSPRSLIAS